VTACPASANSGASTRAATGLAALMMMMMLLAVRMPSISTSCTHYPRGGKPRTRPARAELGFPADLFGRPFRPRFRLDGPSMPKKAQLSESMSLRSPQCVYFLLPSCDSG
jgi:hypothetical protein